MPISIVGSFHRDLRLNYWLTANRSAEGPLLRTHQCLWRSLFKELIGEEFGDGIMSAIDFKMLLQREPDPSGDRVRIAMSGKFLPNRQD